LLTTIKNYNLEDVKRSLKDFLEKGSVDTENVRQLALNIVSNKEDEIAAVYDWVKENVRYTPEENELFISPIRMAKDYFAGNALGGDCDDFALLTASLLRSLGYNTRILLVDIQGNGLDHAIAQVYSKEVWINLDASSEFPLGWEIKSYSKVVIS